MGNENSSLTQPHNSRSRSSSATSTSSTTSFYVARHITPSSKQYLSPNSPYINPNPHLSTQHISSTPSSHPYQQKPTPRPSPIQLNEDLDTSFLKMMDPRSPRPRGGCAWMYGAQEVDENGSERFRFGFGDVKGSGRRL